MTWHHMKFHHAHMLSTNSGLRQRQWGRWASWLDDTRWLISTLSQIPSKHSGFLPSAETSHELHWNLIVTINQDLHGFSTPAAMFSVHRCSCGSCGGETWLRRHAINNSNISTKRCRSVLQLLWFSFSIGISVARSLTCSFPFRW